MSRWPIGPAYQFPNSKRWGLESQPTWTERRREYRNAQTAVRRGVMLAKAKLIEAVIETEDAQKAYAFSALVSSGRTLDEEAKSRSAAAEAVPTGEAINDPGELNDALSGAIRRKIGIMLGEPGGITLTSIKELQQGLGLLEKLQAKETDGAAKQEAAAGCRGYQTDSGTIRTVR